MARESRRRTGPMSRKRHKPEEIVAKLRQVDVLMAQGTPVADAVRSIGVTEVGFGTRRRCCTEPNGRTWIPAWPSSDANRNRLGDPDHAIEHLDPKCNLT